MFASAFRPHPGRPHPGPQDGRRRFLKHLAQGALGFLVAPGVAQRLFAQPAKAPAISLIVYKDPNCGCCKDWVKHMQKAGFVATVHDTTDMDSIKTTMGVPASLASCHTAVVDRYVFEGHVPADVVQQFLREKPVARGLAVPGMPMGSPGMEGGKKDPFNIILFERSGKNPCVCLPLTATDTSAAYRIQHARERDIPGIAALNNLFAPDGLTLVRTEAFVAAHLDGYLVMRDRDDQLVGCVALDEYSPSLVELVSLAVIPALQGQGLGKQLIEAAAELAERRGYPRIFAISLADQLFLNMGFVDSNIALFPEKIARYSKISRSELSIGKKFCFERALHPS